MTTFVRKPDLNAPRYRVNPENTLSDEVVRLIRNKVSGAKGLTVPAIRNVIKTFNQISADKVVTHRNGVELPEFIGNLFVGSCPKKKSNVDFKTSNDINTVVQHRNWDSDNFLAKIFYFSFGENKHCFKNHELYGFKGCRNLTRAVSAAYRKNWKKYIQIDPHRGLSLIFRKAKIREQSKNRNEILLQTYDEFEF